MGVITRQSAKSFAVTLTGVVIGIINTLFLYPKFLLPEQYGLIQVLLALAVVMTQFSHLGAISTLVNFLPHFRDDKKKFSAFFTLMFITPLAGFSIACIAYIVFQPLIAGAYTGKSQLVTEYYYWVIPIAFCYLYLFLLHSWSRSNMRLTVPTFVLDLLLKILVSAELAAYYLDFVTMDGFILLFTLNYVAGLIILLVYSLREFPVGFSLDFGCLGRSMIIKMATYGLFVIIGAAAAGLVQKIDILMVSSMLGLEMTAIYSIAFFIGVAIELPMRPVVLLSMPLIADAWKNNDLKKIEDVYKKSSLNLFILGGLTFLVIWCNIDEIFAVMPRSELYSQGRTVVLFILLAKMFDMLTGVNGEIIRTSKYYYVDLLTMVFLIIISITANYLLIPAWGMNGAAAATAASVFVFNLIRYIFILKVFHMQPFTVKHGGVAGLLGCLFIMGIFLPAIGEGFWGSVMTIAYRSVISATLFSMVIYKFNLSPDISGIIRQPFLSLGINLRI
ncbi:MAG: lipopolysaccharide biosynthesis protein [Bacteroidetes bacterium]|nr:lipopolysaccharide biosynthesis protein [Bacteroidota bacterium]